MDDRCETCLFFYSYDGESTEEGKCRRFPPVLITGISDENAEYITGVLGGSVDFFSQPWVAPFDLCGEFKQR